MPLTSTDIVNAALLLIDSQAQITALNDGSVEANAASAVYAITVQLLLRQMDPDFARKGGILALNPNQTLTGATPFAFVYNYPADCLRVRQVAPAIGTYDVNDPQPVRAAIAFDPLTVGGPAKVILTNQPTAVVIYTASSVTETQFDPGFTEAVIRRLASPLAMALAGRPDFARELLEESERYAGMAELVDENADGVA